MGGKPHKTSIRDAINTKRLLVNLEEAINVQRMFKMYTKPKTSYEDIIWYFVEQDILSQEADKQHGKVCMESRL